MNVSPSSDEKITTALVHASIFLMFLGPIVPILVWASQRKKSKYVSFHALQAMGYQAFIFWLWMIAIILISILSVCLLFPFVAFLEDSPNPESGIFIFQFFIFALIFGSIGLFFLTGIIGAIYCLLGRDFRYPVLGKWLGRYLSYDTNSEHPIDETQEDNWVAGICHATAIMQLWGVVAPITVWFTQKERSARLRFQSMQAFVYQVIALIAYMMGMVLYMATFFGMIFSLMVGGMMSTSNEIEGPGAAIMLVFLVAMMIFWFVSIILVPIYYLLAGFASVQVIRGRDFRYPIMGRILERRMGISPGLRAAP